MELLSARLRLRQLTPAEMRGLLDGGTQPGALWAQGYPLDGTLVAVAIQLEQPAREPPVEDFGHFQILRRTDGLVIGDIGFQGRPDDLGEVGVGFGVVPAARGGGYAAEALRTLLDWALSRPDVRCVHADTDLVNLASQRVLVRAGMRLSADEGDRKLYEIHAG